MNDSRYSNHNHLGGFSAKCANCNPEGFKMNKLSSEVQDVDRCPNCPHTSKANADGSCSAYGYNGVDCQSQPCVCRNHVPSPSVSEAAPEVIWMNPRHAGLYAQPEHMRDPNDTVEYARVHQPEQNSEGTDLITTIAKMDICSRCNEGWECECPVGLCRAVTEQNLEDKNSGEMK